MHPPRIEPYETLQPLSLHPELASFAVRDRKTGEPATLWLSEEPLRLPPEAASHPHVVQVYAHGMRDGYEYLITEPVHESLRTILAREGVLSSQRAISVSVGVARGLSQLLAAGVPVARIGVADVAVGPDGTPKVIPFSLPAMQMSSDDAGLLSSMGELYYEMLTGRRPRADDPLAAASTEILRGLLRSNLARERMEQRPEPADFPPLPPPPELRAGLPSLTTILRWSGVMAAVAVAAIVLGVQASMRPLAVETSRPAPRVASPSTVASLPAPPAALSSPVASEPRITERLTAPGRHARRRARRAVRRSVVAEAPARPLVSPTVAPVRPRVASGTTLTTPRKAPGRGVSGAVPLARIPRMTPAAPRVFRWRSRETGTRLVGGPMTTRGRELTMARLPSVDQPRERVLSEAPMVFRESDPLLRRAARTPAEDARVPSVRLKIVLDAEGHPETALVVRSSGDPRRDRAAVQAAREMRFDPPRSRSDEAEPRRGGVAYATLAVPSADFPRLARPLSVLP